MKRDQRGRGRYLGGAVPFGYRVVPDTDGGGGDLVEDPDQQHAFVRIADLRAQGLSLRAISEALAADGIALSYVAVKKIIDRGVARPV